MTTVTEGSLQITFPDGVHVRKFDDGPSHGLSHCMKAVDFIAELPDKFYFIEVKDPQDPAATEENASNFIEKFTAGKIDEMLKYKYRDTFLYEWCAERASKPIHYFVLIAIENLDDAMLVSRTDDLKRKLPCPGPLKGAWRRSFVENCTILNIKTWNKFLPDYPVTRVAPS